MSSRFSVKIFSRSGEAGGGGGENKSKAAMIQSDTERFKRQNKSFHFLYVLGQSANGMALLSGNIKTPIHLYG
jgi:hypothetical protein